MSASDCLQPLGLSPTRLLCPRDFPGKNTGVGCHFLLQGIFPTQGSMHFLRLLHWRAHSLPLSHLGSSGFPDAHIQGMIAPTMLVSFLGQTMLLSLPPVGEGGAVEGVRKGDSSPAQGTDRKLTEVWVLISACPGDTGEGAVLAVMPFLCVSCQWREARTRRLPHSASGFLPQPLDPPATISPFHLALTCSFLFFVISC